LKLFAILIIKPLNVIISNEDFIWSAVMKREGKVPSFNVALRFAFDNYPQHAFMLNNGKLPFGCHAWDLYHSYEFWRKHIQ
jgi:hypothetical protein